MDPNRALEERTTSLARQLSARSRGVPRLFDSGGWIGRIMDRAMRSEDFKLRLFRFVDVLPSLRTDELAVRLLREYFSDPGDAASLIGRGVRILPERGPIAWAAGRAVRAGVRSLARQFIAGRDEPEILGNLRSLRSGGTDFTLDLLGEVVVSDREAGLIAERYRSLLEMLAAEFPEGGRGDVSLKVSSFDSQLDPVDWDGSVRRTAQNLRPLLRKAQDAGVSLTLDMEHYHVKDLTLAVFKQLLDEEEFREAPGLGIALQAYLRESEQDVRRVIAWARERGRRIHVRLVKGAYWDFEVVANRQQEWPVPVFLRKEETDASFERLTRLLFDNADVVSPGIATHNLRSIAHAMAVAEATHISPHAFEFQMLYGMAEPLRKAVLEQGYRMRVYVPVGELVPGMAYLVRRLLENTSNESFLRRSFRAVEPFESLMKPPAIRKEPAPPPGPDRFRNEPLLDFSLLKNREAMQDALRSVKDRLHARYPLLIGSREVQTGREIVSRNPARPREVIGTVSAAARTEVDAALAEALRTAPQWRKTRPAERAAFLFRAAQAMRARRTELAALEVLEVGKTWKDADGDVAEAIDYLEYYGREMLRLGAPRGLGEEYPGEENRYGYLPLGVGVVIAPWNFPLAIATGMTSAAIVAGNCAIFKPSGLSPVTGSMLCDVLSAAGLPPGVLQFLPGPGSEIGEYLVAHPAIDFIAFTGSRDVGLRIVRLAAERREGQRNIKRVIAELGGKNAVIVDETADLDEAVKGILESAFGYQGQKCSACSRVIALEAVVNELCDRLREAAASLAIGPPEDPAHSVGPVIDDHALARIRDYIAIGKSDAATVLEQRAEGEGWFVGPVIFRDPRPGSRILSEEIFGPVLTVQTACNVEEAILLANTSEYALTGGLYSRSPANMQRVRDDFLAGNLYINRKITGALVGRQPFGGFRMSGVGSKAGGPDYLLQFMHPQTLTENTIRRGFAPMRKMK